MFVHGLFRPYRAGFFVNAEPRALPWATLGRPFGASEGWTGYGVGCGGALKLGRFSCKGLDRVAAEQKG